MLTLKNCPVCGAKALLDYGKAKNNHVGFYAFCTDTDCTKHAPEKAFSSISAAAAAWNKKERTAQ